MSQTSAEINIGRLGSKHGRIKESNRSNYEEATEVVEILSASPAIVHP
jgi:hypothetical protein